MLYATSMSPTSSSLSLQHLHPYSLYSHESLLLTDHSLWRSLLLTNIASTSFTVTLLTSISVYRLFLSPIRNFPGPTLAGLSKFWYIYHSAGGGMPKVVSELHVRYGDIVRIGPNELSICLLDAVEVILGSKGKMSKGPWSVILRLY